MKKVRTKWTLGYLGILAICSCTRNPIQPSQPSVTLRVANTRVEKGDTLVFWMETDYKESIAQYYWDVVGDSLWDDTTTSDTFRYVWNDLGRRTVRAAFEDTAGILSNIISIQIRVADEELDSAWLYLQLHFIFQDSLPPDSAVDTMQTPQQLYTSVNEPYTQYLPPDSAQAFLTSLTTEQSAGVGIIIDSTGLGYVIRQVIADSPGEKAGLQKGDTIIAVGDSSAQGSLSRLRGLIRGEAGDERVFQIQRDTSELTIHVTLGSFLAPSVFTDSLEPDIAYILLFQFAKTTVDSDGTSAEFRKALEATEWAKFTLLDLRGNPGGHLDQVTDVISEFVPEGTEIAHFNQRVVAVTDKGLYLPFNQQVTYTSKQGGVAQTRDFVLLVDKSSASAAELLASVLRDQREFKLVGRTTFGKARAQVLRETPREGLCKITYATMKPVKGDDYDMVGIVPDYITDTSLEAEDQAVALIHEWLGTPSAKAKKQREYMANRIHHLRTQILPAVPRYLGLISD